MILSSIQTLGLAAALWMIGEWLKLKVGWLQRHNLPAPVIGGLILAIPLSILRSQYPEALQFENQFQEPLMIAFFASVGFGASYELLKKGGHLVLWFLIVCSLFAILQNLVGVLVTKVFGLHPLIGVLTGSVALTGGPATALAFASTFEQSGVANASVFGLAAAMTGILIGGITGTPLATRLIEKVNHQKVTDSVSSEVSTQETTGFMQEAHQFVILIVVMALGTVVSKWIKDSGVNLPIYIGAMLIAAIARNIDDHLRVFKIQSRAMDQLGEIALSLFIALAMMTLKLEALAGVAIPLIVIMVLQTLLIFFGAVYLIHRQFGRDYQSAVMASGFVGFMMGTTANAMANMNSLVKKYGPAPRAFLVVPLVGACFIDFVNATLVTFFLNIFK